MITLGGDAELELVDSLDPFSEGIVFRYYFIIQFIYIPNYFISGENNHWMGDQDLFNIFLFIL